jgi:hypothetical protein
MTLIVNMKIRILLELFQCLIYYAHMYVPLVTPIPVCSFSCLKASADPTLG